MEEYSNDNITLNMSMVNIRSFTAWATFRAIIDIIAGAFACLGIVTAAFGIPQIIAATKLLNAVSDMKAYMAVNDQEKISQTFIKLNSYFKINGIATIVKVIIVVFLVFLYAAVVIFWISRIFEIYDSGGMEYFF